MPKRQAASETGGASQTKKAKDDADFDQLVDRIMVRIEERSKIAEERAAGRQSDGSEVVASATASTTPPPGEAPTPTPVSVLKAAAAMDQISSAGDNRFISISDHVPEAVLSDIWADKAIDFVKLLPGYNQEEEPDKKKKKNVKLNFYQWVKAYHIFVDVYAKKCPGEVSGLLAHAQLIQELDEDYGQEAFLYYDTAFREQRQRHGLPWGVMHQVLWMRATTLHASRPKAAAPRTGVCYKFNRRYGCQSKSCQYPHICDACSGEHPRYLCRATGPKTAPVSMNSSMNSSSVNRIHTASRVMPKRESGSDRMLQAPTAAVGQSRVTNQPFRNRFVWRSSSNTNRQ